MKLICKHITLNNMLPLTISKVVFPANQPIESDITVDLYIKPYYEPDTSYELIEGNVSVDVNGNILASPLPSTEIDPTEQYVLKVINDTCGIAFIQEVVLFPYCQPGYELSSDASICSQTDVVSATPPTNPQVSVSQTNANYSLYGTFIYAPGYNSDGTGSSTRINPSNGFWINPTADTTDGPLNRAGLWTASPQPGQQIGFSVCLEFDVDTTVLIGMGTDNYGIINLDGNNIVTQNPTTLAAQYNSEFPGIGAFVTFRIWHVYPVMIPAGTHVLEMIGFNVSGPATMGVEVYAVSAAALPLITSYADLGANLIFSSKNFIGEFIQSGNMGFGYSCPFGFSFQPCDSPPTCLRVRTTPVLF